MPRSNTLENVLRRYCLAVFVSICVGQANAAVSVAGGNDRWSNQLREQWLQPTRKAVSAFKDYTHDVLGEGARDVPDIVLAANPAAAAAASKQSGDIILSVQHSGLQFEMYRRTTVATLEGLTRRYLESISAGRQDAAPAWLSSGLISLVPYQALQAGGLDPAVPDLQEWVSKRVRNSQAVPDAEFVVRQTRIPSSALDFQAVATVFVEVLQTQVGKDFPRDWVRFYSELKNPSGGHVSEKFKTVFGVAESDLVPHVEARLRELRAEQRQHADSVPAATAEAAVNEKSALPVDLDSVRNGFLAYLKARSPKAFALGPRGAYAYFFDDARAMPRALDACKNLEPVGCQLFAVDDLRVYQDQQAGNGNIEVLMFNGEDGAWRSLVSRIWAPIVTRSALAFNTHATESLKVGLNQPVRIHVAATRNDYAYVLANAMQMTEAGADEFAYSGGVSNGRGQIAVAFLDTMSERQKNERAVKTTLHELTHALQAQLSRQKRGFVPPPWLLEGSADYFAYSIASQLNTSEAAEFSYAKWREGCIKRYKEFRLTASVDELLSGNYKDWLSLSRFHKGNYEVAGLMVVFLNEKLGERFSAAWVEYFRLAGEKGRTEPQAFEQSFGMSREAYAAELKAWMATL